LQKFIQQNSSLLSLWQILKE